MKTDRQQRAASTFRFRLGDKSLLSRRPRSTQCTPGLAFSTPCRARHGGCGGSRKRLVLAFVFLRRLLVGLTAAYAATRSFSSNGPSTTATPSLTSTSQSCPAWRSSSSISASTRSSSRDSIRMMSRRLTTPTTRPRSMTGRLFTAVLVIRSAAFATSVSLVAVSACVLMTSATRDVERGRRQPHRHLVRALVWDDHLPDHVRLADHADDVAVRCRARAGRDRVLARAGRWHLHRRGLAHRDRRAGHDLTYQHPNQLLDSWAPRRLLGLAVFRVPPVFGRHGPRRQGRWCRRDRPKDPAAAHWTASQDVPRR